MPRVLHVEVHEGADMEDLLDRLGSRELMREMFGLENIAVALPPRRVIDFGDDEIRLLRIGLTKAVVKGDRVEHKAKMADLG